MNTINEWIEVVTMALTHSLWQGAIIAGGVALMLRLVPRSCPAVRSGLALVALVSLAAWIGLTVLYLMPPGDEVLHRAGTAAAVPPMDIDGAINTRAGNATGSVHWQSVVVAAWAVGVLVFALRMSGAALVLQRLRGRMEEVDNAQISECFEAARRRLVPRSRVVLRCSSAIDSPMTFGWLRPVVLIPASLLTAMPITHLQAVFAHELLHVRRSDFAIQVALLGLRSLLFYHPGVWWMTRVVEVERELACDLGALRGVDGGLLFYARALLELDAWRSTGSVSVPAGGVAIHGGESLRVRVERLIEVRQRGMVSEPSILPALSVVLAAIFAVVSGWQAGGDGAERHSANGSDYDSSSRSDHGFERLVKQIRNAIDDAKVAVDIVEGKSGWAIPAGEQRLMRARTLLEVDGKVRPFGVDDPPVFSGIENQWILNYGLNYVQAGVATRDDDRDGFSNKEEFVGQTSPVDAEDHPPAVGKLKFLGLRQQLYRLEFAAQPDGRTFQINRLPSASWKRKTMLLKLGESSDDGQIELLSFDRDEGTLELRHKPTGRKYRVQKSGKADLAILFAEMQMTIGDKQLFRVREGQEFSPGGGAKRWKVESVAEDSVTLIEGETKERRILQK